MSTNFNDLLCHNADKISELFEKIYLGNLFTIIMSVTEISSFEDYERAKIK